MPVLITRQYPDDRESEEIAYLCLNEWLLCQLVPTFEDWLEEYATTLPAADYVVDIGFKWRKSAATGGPVFDSATIKKMADVGMSLHLSEYDGFADEPESQEAEHDDSPNG